MSVQGYLMQMLAVKLGVATGLNLAEHCRWVSSASITMKGIVKCIPF